GIADALAISAANSWYPLFSSHAHIHEVEGPDFQVEWAYPAALNRRLAETGAVIGLRTPPFDARAWKRSGVPDDCPGSTKSFAQVYRFATEGLGLSVAFASDLGGWATNLRPRFGPEACTGRSGADADLPR